MGTIQEDINKAQERIDIAVEVFKSARDEAAQAKRELDYANSNMSNVHYVIGTGMSESDVAAAKTDIRAKQDALLEAIHKREMASIDVEFLRGRLAALTDEANPVETLATALHKRQCHLSHMDQCGWEYATDFSKGERTHWVKKARALLEVVNNDLDMALNVVKVI